MFPIRTSATDAAGILYPSLCPIGFDPVLEQDIRIAAARSWRNPRLRSAPGAPPEASVNSMLSGYWPGGCVATGSECQEPADKGIANASRGHNDGIRSASQSVS